MTEQPHHKCKGIILAAGTGTRLFPVTLAVNKQFLCVYDKPMIYYPLSVLMLAGIRDVLVITTQEDLCQFRRLFGDGSALGLRISYAVQPRPEGIPQAFLIGKEFIGTDSVCLTLGDNIFYGNGLQDALKRAAQAPGGGRIFGCCVNDPERYGVVEFDDSGRVLGIEEKPALPKSNYAVAGLYFFDNDVVEIASKLKPSARGELEMADVIQKYLHRGDLTVELLGKGFSWFDTGTHESLLEASLFVRNIQKEKGISVACPEEIAYRMGYINAERVGEHAVRLQKSGYGQYLLKIAEGARPSAISL